MLNSHASRTDLGLSPDSRGRFVFFPFESSARPGTLAPNAFNSKRIEVPATLECSFCFHPLIVLSALTRASSFTMMQRRIFNRQGMMLSAVLATAITLFLRAIIPVGYMVAVDGGALAIIPCAGLTTVAQHDTGDASAHHGHHSGLHDEDGGKQEPAQPSTHFSACPFATSCCAVGVTASIVPRPALPIAAEVFSIVRHDAAIALAHQFLARAPPRIA